MKILETDRLILRKLTDEDAPFILKLLNEPSWLRYIGDRGVKSLADAAKYIVDGPMASYERFGFGLYLVELKDGATPIGMCGLLKRDTLPDVDIGFAFLPAYWGQGYAGESAAAVLDHARSRLGLSRIVAITNDDNHSSVRLLEKLGMKFERMIQMTDKEPPLKLFARALTTGETP